MLIFARDKKELCLWDILPKLPRRLTNIDISGIIHLLLLEGGVVMSDLDKLFEKFNGEHRSDRIVAFLSHVGGIPLVIEIRFPKSLAYKTYEHIDFVERHFAWKQSMEAIMINSHGLIRATSDREAFEHGVIDFSVNPMDPSWDDGLIQGALRAIVDLLENGF